MFSIGYYRPRGGNNENINEVTPMTPGAFWIVEIDGQLTIGQVVEGLTCGSPVTSWRIVSDAPVRQVDTTEPEFRAFRWLDVEGLIDRPAPIRTAGAPPEIGEFWLIAFHGHVTVGKLLEAGDAGRFWELPGYIGAQREEGGTFRPVRRIDVAALMDFVGPSPEQIDRIAAAAPPEKGGGGNDEGG